MFLLTDGLWKYFQAAGQFLYSLALGLGGPGLFLLALADSSFLSVPEGNDILIVVLATGQSWETMSYYVAMTIMGSVTGCCILFTVGRRGGAFMQRRFSKSKMRRAESIYRRWGLWAVLVPAILPPPTPFKIFVFSAGAFGLSFRRFLLAVLAGRSIRYFSWGILAVLYGEAAKRFLEENIQMVGSTLMLLLLSGLLLYVIIRIRSRNSSSEELA